MMMKIRRCTLLLLSIIASSVFAADFKWQAVTDQDWAVTENPGRGFHYMIPSREKVEKLVFKIDNVPPEELGLQPQLIHVIDRDDNFFVYQAKYWQFDHSIVGVVDSKGQMRFMAPGQKFLEFGSIPWYSQASVAIMMDKDLTAAFVNLPESSPRSNRIQRLQFLSFDASMKLQGTLSERLYGANARQLRLKLYDETSSEQISTLKARLEGTFSQYMIEDLACTGIDTLDESLKLNCRISRGPSVQELGKRLPGSFL